MKKLTTTFLIIINYFVLTGFLYSQTPGDLDDTFNEIGYLETDFGIPTRITGVEIQNDGKIVVAGYSYYEVFNIALARYHVDGSLDLSFGSSGLGYFSHVFNASNEIVNDMVLQPDGKILITGYTNDDGTYLQDAFVARLNEDGTFDNTFSSDGIQIADVGDFDVSNSIYLQDDGKILIYGTTSNSNSDHNFLVCRYNSNGQLDTSFGNNGQLIIDIDYGSYDYGQGIAVLNGYIYMAGLSYSDVDRVVIVSLNANGQMNVNFGSGGKLGFIMDLYSTVLSNGTDLIITQDNKIAVSAFQNSGTAFDFVVIKALSNGFPDEDFGDHGVVITNMIGDNKPNKIFEQPDGNILLGGYHEDNIYEKDFTLARYLDNGELDASFGNYYGVTWENISSNEQNPNDVIYSLATQNDGKIIAAGYAQGAEYPNFAVARFYSGIEVGIDDNTKKAPEIYYVRSNYSIHINCSDGKSPEQLFVFDITGRKVLDLTPGNNLNGKYSFKINQSLKAGIYLVKTKIDNIYYLEKIVIN